MVLHVFDAGLFIILNLIGFGLMLIGIKFYGYLYIIAMVIFFALALVLMAGYDVGSYHTSFDGTSWINGTDYLIGGNQSVQTIGGDWLGWVYLLIGMGNIYLLFKDMWK